MEIKNLNEYKFVLASGCSYGFMPSIVVNPLSYSFNKSILNGFENSYIDTDNKILVLSVNIGSQSSDWQSDSIIHLCTKILEMGVNPSNIYCMVEWTQWHRFNIHPFNLLNLDLDKFNWRDWNSFTFHELDRNKNIQSNELTNEIYNKLNITCSNHLYNVGKINNRIYINPSHMSKKDFMKLGDEFGYLIDKAQEVENQLMFENKIKNYLNNILRTQFFFKMNNLKYNFLFMQSTLSEWQNLGAGLIKQELNMSHGSYQFYSDTEKKVITNPNYKKTNNPNSDIEVVLPETKTEIEKIDFDNIWFHESDKYRRGGIDEWTIENLKEVGYIKIFSEEANFDKRSIICNYNQHPNFVAYLNIWNKAAKNCDFLKVNDKFLNDINEKYWEDYNYDGKTKNHITISKNEWYRINNQ